ncbi:hypothetical protein [Pelosinus sp. UFO1]|uniref:hypothetical protein n=1 Tax=Pelosinus sp. UFO1 TaxID=484770 RepID=UPI0004D13FC3|nr:hypothetical protein [Pelosinus sp. UFO1]AIF54119.1 hypothetical protein UFO1_4584 [Pelosinus sp. UFO1]
MSQSNIVAVFSPRNSFGEIIPAGIGKQKRCRALFGSLLINRRYESNVGWYRVSSPLSMLSKASIGAFCFVMIERSGDLAKCKLGIRKGGEEK